jgi:hypothetical protein
MMSGHGELFHSASTMKIDIAARRWPVGAVRGRSGAAWASVSTGAAITTPSTRGQAKVRNASRSRCPQPSFVVASRTSDLSPA